MQHQVLAKIVIYEATNVYLTSQYWLRWTVGQASKKRSFV
jgi:hypothetical protein